MNYYSPDTWNEIGDILKKEVKEICLKLIGTFTPDIVKGLLPIYDDTKPYINYWLLVIVDCAEVIKIKWDHDCNILDIKREYLFTF